MNFAASAIHQAAELPATGQNSLQRLFLEWYQLKPGSRKAGDLVNSAVSCLGAERGMGGSADP